MVDGSGEDIRTLSANVSGSLSSFADVTLDGAGVFDGGDAANGLLFGAADDEEEEDAEKGFELDDNVLPVNELAPKRLAPRSCLGLDGCCTPASVACLALSSPLDFVDDVFSVFCSVNFLVDRNARTLPDFRLHAFLGQPNMYNLLS